MVRFTTHKRWSEEGVAQRLNQIVRADGFTPIRAEDGKWVLDFGNNWWMNKIGDNEYELRTRLPTRKSDALLGPMKPFLEYTFG